MINQKSSQTFNKYQSGSQSVGNSESIRNIETRFSGLKLDSPNAKIKLANFMWVLFHLSSSVNESNSLFGNNSSNDSIVTSNRAKLILALLDLKLGLNETSANALIDICLDASNQEHGLNFKQIYNELTSNSYIANSANLFSEAKLKEYKLAKLDGKALTQEELLFDKLVNQINIGTRETRNIFVATLTEYLAKLSSKPVEDTSYLKLLLSIAADLEFSKSDTTDKFAETKLVDALEKYAIIIKNDIAVDLIKNTLAQIKANIQTDSQVSYANQDYSSQKSGYSNQDAIANDLNVGYENTDSSQKSGYSNQDAIANDLNSGYQNTHASNQAQNIVSVANVSQSLASLIISIKDYATGMIKSSYKVCPLLSQEEATLIEQQCGVVLKKDSANPGMFNGFLGGGAFGRVYVAREENINPAKYVAIKIVQGDQRALVESKHESGLQLKLTQAVNVEDSQLMPIIGIGENLSRTQSEAEKLYIVMPLAGMGSGEGLRKDLSELKQANNSPEFFRLLNLHIAKSMLLGLWQMHYNDIYHLDLKPANMMVTGDGKIQLSDFGTSEEVAGNPPSLTVARSQTSGRLIGNGDSTYFPPERDFYEGTNFNPAKADIYSAGLVLFEFLSGEEFDGSDPLKHPIFSNVVKGSLEELTLRLLNPQHTSRISLEDALDHPSLGTADAHDPNLMKVVLNFLGSYVKYAQSKARGELSSQQASQVLQASLAQSQLISAETNLESNPLVMDPFKNRPDVHEQLAMYLPLSVSAKRKIEDPTQDIIDLHQQTQSFLTSAGHSLLLLLADGGSGKSLYMQYLTTTLGKTNAPSGKPYLPLYIVLSRLTHPSKLFEDGLGITSNEVKELQTKYEIIILADGFDEQTNWGNLYSQNKLEQYDTANSRIKLVITCRINALPPSYSEYFDPKVVGENGSRGMQEFYVQPFKLDQIDTYVSNYINQHKTILQDQIKQNQLPPQWLEPKYVQDQISQIPGLKELMQTPLLSRLVLIALPQLSKDTNQQRSGSSKITRAEVYAAFMRQWIITQIVTKQGRLASEITPDEINQVLAFGQKIALSMYEDNKSAELNVGLASFSFNPRVGKYQQNPSKYAWFEQAKQQQMLLPLQESQAGAYKFVHLSMQEYLLASYLASELNQSPTLKDLNLNELALTIDEKDRPILYFLGDMAGSSKVTEDNLFGLINQTKIDKTQSRAGANAISILTASNVQLVSRDFSNTSLPYADLSGAVLFNTNFTKADLTESNLKGARLNYSNFSEAYLSEIRLGQYPMYPLQEGIKAICYSPDGRYLAVSQNVEMRLFNAITRSQVRRFKGHTGWINSISFSGDGTKVVTGSRDRTCRLWDVESGKELGVLSGHTSDITSVSFSADGRIVATGSYDQTCRLWDVKSFKELGLIRVNKSIIWSVSFSPDGRIVATGSEDKTCRLWDVASFKVLGVLRGHISTINSVSFSPDGRIIATGSQDSTCRLWDVTSLKELGVLSRHTGVINSVSFSPDGRIVATGSDDNTCRLWDVASFEELGVLSGHTSGIKSVSFSADGRRVATGSEDKTCQLWDVGSGKELGVLRGHTDLIKNVSFSPDGKLVATGSKDKTCRLWDVASGKELGVLSGHTDSIFSVSFSPDGTKVATGSKDKTCRLWDVSNGKELCLLRGHEYDILSVTFSLDGRLVATGSYDKTCRLWDAARGKELGVFRGHTDSIFSVSFSPDGRRVATGSSDSICRLWDVSNGKELCLLRGHKYGILSLTFSPDGRLVVTGSRDRTCRLWDVESGKELGVLSGHTNDITSVSFSPDGTKLISRDQGGIKKVWLLADKTELTGDQATLVPQRANHTLDDITANYEGKRVTLSQNLMASTNTSTSIESFSIDFPDRIEDISLSKDDLGNKVVLTVVMAEGVAFYAKELNAPLNGFIVISVSMVNQVLGASNMDVSGSIGLSKSNYEVLKQLGASGKPAKLAEPDQPSMPELQAKDSEKMRGLQ